MSAEEERLSTVISNSFVGLSLSISALWVTSQNASLVVLAEPTWVGQRQIGKGLLALNVVPKTTKIIRKNAQTIPYLLRGRLALPIEAQIQSHTPVPRRPDVVKPAYDALDGIPN